MPLVEVLVEGHSGARDLQNSSNDCLFRFEPEFMEFVPLFQANDHLQCGIRIINFFNQLSF